MDSQTKEQLWRRVYGQPRGFDPKYIHDEMYSVALDNNGNYLLLGGSGDEYSYSAEGSGQWVGKYSFGNLSFRDNLKIKKSILVRQDYGVMITNQGRNDTLIHQDWTPASLNPRAIPMHNNTSTTLFRHQHFVLRLHRHCRG